MITHIIVRLNNMYVASNIILARPLIVLTKLQLKVEIYISWQN